MVLQLYLLVISGPTLTQFQFLITSTMRLPPISHWIIAMLDFEREERINYIAMLDF